MTKDNFDFYSPFNLKAYNLDIALQYQLKLLESLDPFTRKHSENVANLVCRICKYMHFNTKYIIYCTICAYIHDIGKLFIPTEILNKPDKLTDEEYEIMKKHTTYGYDMCMKDLKLRPYAFGPLYHHEALNGTGYPNGLTKRDIPRVGQIIRVADQYDAIVTKRQYKTHINISETLKDLIKDTKPEEHIKAIALSELADNSKVGKINPKILKVLFKVVIDDTLYEIYCIKQYVEYLKEQIERLKLIDNYYTKSKDAKTDKKKEYYLNGVKVLLTKDENIDNYKDILNDYKTALNNKKFMIDRLYDEIKIIKHLKI